MGVSAEERAGSRRLLALLNTADLFSLAGTVTKKKSTVCTRAEAIDTIVQNSHSAYELLNRRNVLRDTIAVYLKNEGIPLQLRYTKAEVIQKTLKYWNNLDSCKPITRTFIPSSKTWQEDSDPDSPNPFSFHTLKSSTKERSHEDDSKTSNLGAPTRWSFNNELQFSSIVNVAPLTWSGTTEYCTHAGAMLPGNLQRPG
ncbi:uncharacterized protein C3orf38-like isoform 1-T1 [Anomaloglossus baeobatrachus]|uniref:uncharacterized protein C3orf38-like n=1 Tax=Anomaloglossus baeobatrachus TaxID=238106 RepID=UPI003F4F653C